MSSKTIISEPKYEEEQGQGLAAVLYKNPTIQGWSQAIEEGEDLVSHGTLHKKALSLASKIHDSQPTGRSPVGILIPRSINHVLSQMAIVYSGRACVPLDDQLPDSSLKARLENVGSTLFLTDVGNKHRLRFFQVLVVDHQKISIIPGAKFQPIERDPQACCHLFHTSGTTGKPKAVEARAKGLINLCFDPIGFVREGQRLCHAARPMFDVSALEIWATLLNGGTIVIVPQETLLNPPSFSNFLSSKRIDVLLLTVSLLTVTAYGCPGAFSSLDTLVTGGEAINCQAIQ